MKRIFSSVMALGLATTLVACGGDTNQPADNTADTETTETVDDDAAQTDADTETEDDADMADETDEATEDDAEEDDAEETDDETAEEEGLSSEEQAELEDFDNVTADDTLVIGNSEMSGDWVQGWSNNSYDVRVRRLLGTDGFNGYVTVVQDENGEWQQNKTVLAEDYTSKDNEDGTRTYTFKINKGLKWSDGEEVTADDYLFGILFFSHPDYIPVTGSSSIGSEKLFGYNAYHDSEADIFEGVKKIDDYTFECTVDSEFIPFFEEASLSATSPFPIHAVSENLTINEEGNKIVPVEGYEATEEEAKEYKDSLQEQIDNLNTQFEEDNPAPADDAEEDEKAAYDEAKKAHDEQIADLESRLEGEVDPTSQLLTTAMLKYANEYRLNPSVVDGPYVLDSYENNMARLSLNPNYAGNFRGEKATIPHVILQVINKNIAIDLLENGDIDIWEDETTGGKIDQLRAAADDGKLQYNAYPRNGYGNIVFLTDRGSTQYKEVRQAIAHLMDRNTFIQSFAGGYGVIVNGAYGIAQWMYQERGADLEAEKLINYQLNIDKANELLDESPYKYEADGKTPWDQAKAEEAFAADSEGFDYYRYDENGKKLVVNHYGTEEVEMTTLINNQLPNNAKQAGMEYNVTAGSFATLLDYYYTPEDDAEYTAFNMGTSFGIPYDPWTSYNSESTTNYTKVNDPKADELTVKLRQTDPEDREGYLDTWEEYQIWFNDYLPEIPLYSNQYHTGFTNRVKGFDVNTPFWTAEDQINGMSLGE